MPTNETHPYAEIVPSGQWRFPLRLTAAIAGILTMVLLMTACGGGGAGGSAVTVATVTPGAGGAALPLGPTATPFPTPPHNAEGQLTGFIYPIEDGCLPAGDQLMPNAPRQYRLGVHEGVDFYNVDNCTPISRDTPVLAVFGGVVVRVDHDYQDLTPASLQPLLDDPSTEEALDAFRGRQVWIDHGDDIVTRYCHLSGVAAGLQEGDYVEQGTIVGFVGESGTPESVTNPGNEVHLHFEVRIGDSFLGEGLPPGQVRAEYLALFSD